MNTNLELNQSFIEVLLLRLDSHDQNLQFVISQEVEDWPEGLLDILCREGLLIPTTPSNLYTCTSCGDPHDEEVFTIESPPGSALRFYIRCPLMGRIRVDPVELRQWQLSPEGWAKLTGRLLCIAGSCQELISDRAWRMGAANMNGAYYEAMFIRGICWSDGNSLKEKVIGTDRSTPMVLVAPYKIPNGPLLYPLPLYQVLRLVEGELLIDQDMLNLIISAWPIPEPASEPAQGYMFIKQGDYWTIRFEGKQSVIKHSQGLEYIARLLASPNTEIHVLTLAISANREVPTQTALAYQNMSEEQLTEEDMSISDLGDAGEILDYKAKKAYKERLEEIDEELEQAEKYNDQGRTAQLREEKGFIIQQLSAAFGLGGRDRKAASALDRARTAVRHSIERAIKNIGKQDTQLAQFLTNSIKTGNICIYSPDKEIPWN